MSILFLVVIISQISLWLSCSIAYLRWYLYVFTLHDDFFSEAQKGHHKLDYILMTFFCLLVTLVLWSFTGHTDYSRPPQVRVAQIRRRFSFPYKICGDNSSRILVCLVN